jgi:hypothetical protein
MLMPIRVPSPDLQVAFFRRLQEVRDRFLLDALLATVARLDVQQLDNELAATVPKEPLRTVASWGLRGEILFPVPCLLQANPRLLGYYRLLLGFSQKQFYSRDYGLGTFKSMEDRGSMSSKQSADLTALCHALCLSAEELISGTGRLSTTSIHELTLLTLGPQLRGAKLNLLGSEVTRRVFHLIKEIVAPATLSSSDREIQVRNAAGRTVLVQFANDPDICIRERLPSGAMRNLVAIEIKGGRDVSNVHNRIGEAEKSHQKASKEGFVEFWTILGVPRLDLGLASKESPTTDRFFLLDEIATEGGPQLTEFREQLLSRVGVRD